MLCFFSGFSVIHVIMHIILISTSLTKMHYKQINAYSFLVFIPNSIVLFISVHAITNLSRKGYISQVIIVIINNINSLFFNTCMGY